MSSVTLLNLCDDVAINMIYINIFGTGKLVFGYEDNFCAGAGIGGITNTNQVNICLSLYYIHKTNNEQRKTIKYIIE